jgi:hypothetical protein
MYTTTSDDQLIECLRATPSLEGLSLTRTKTTFKTLQMLTLQNISNPELPNVLLPKLKVLNWSGITGSNFPVLISFLRSRRDNIESTPLHIEPSSTARLQSFTLDICGTNAVPDPRTKAELQRFVKEGMDMRISIHYRPYSLLP